MLALQSYTGADVVLSSRGLNLVGLTCEIVERFVPRIAKASLEEFETVVQLDPRNTFMNLLTHDGCECYAIMSEDTPLALTGVTRCADYDVMWVCFSEDLRKHFVKFMRASPDLITYYHQRYPELACDVWAKAQPMIEWLVMLDFEPEFEFAHNGHPMVHFVRYCSDEESVVTSPQRPVVH